MGHFPDDKWTGNFHRENSTGEIGKTGYLNVENVWEFIVNPKYQKCFPIQM